MSHSKTFFRKGLRKMATLVPVSALPVDALLSLVQRFAAGLAHVVFVHDWQLEARGRPQFFKHQINLSRWSSEPFRWSFTARGVYAREAMFRGCKVLDLCCGDGSYSFLFFSDVAGHIDAIDNDPYAIAYARKYRASPPISYRQVDIVAEPLPAGDYDVIVWNAAICYFADHEIRQILSKIIAAGKPSMKLCGMLPKANGWIDHKTEFADVACVDRFLAEFFALVSVREIDEGSAITFYFQASAPLNPGVTA